MRIVTQTETLARFYTDEEAVQILAKAGFDAIDWSFFDMLKDDNIWCSDDWKAHAESVKQTAAACGIGFRQAHAPFAPYFGDEEKTPALWNKILRAMEAAAYMGVKNIVVHPIQHLPYAKNKQLLFDMNVAMYKKLIPYCEKFGIRVCCENMYQYDSKREVIVNSICADPEEFCALLEAIDSEWIIGCLDIGHSALTGYDPAEFIEIMGPKRLQCLHVHDVDHKHDCHTMPYMQKLDWESVMAALAKIGFTGDFTLEADNFLKQFPKELQPDAACLMAKTARYLTGRFEANKA